MTSAVRVILLLFVAASVIYLIVSETRAPSSAEAPRATHFNATQAEETARSGKVASDAGDARHARTVAYYFHGTMRCPTCLTMERYAREAIEEDFGAEIDTGLVERQSVNYDEPTNEHFVQEYGLSASALVLVSAPDGRAPRSRNLDRIWELASDEASFKAYVVEAVNAMLRGES